MNSEEEGSVLNSVEVQPVEPTREIEGSDEGTFVSEERSINKVHGLSVLCHSFSAWLLWSREIRPTLSVSINLGKLEQRVGMPWQLSEEIIETLWV